MNECAKIIHDYLLLFFIMLTNSLLACFLAFLWRIGGYGGGGLLQIDIVFNNDLCVLPHFVGL